MGVAFLREKYQGGRGYGKKFPLFLSTFPLQIRKKMYDWPFRGYLCALPKSPGYPGIRNRPDNAWIFVILPGFCDLVHIYLVIGLFAKRKNDALNLY